VTGWYFLNFSLPILPKGATAIASTSRQLYEKSNSSFFYLSSEKHRHQIPLRPSSMIQKSVGPDAVNNDHQFIHPCRRRLQSTFSLNYIAVALCKIIYFMCIGMAGIKSKKCHE
jgi:hypothetical protein